MGVWPVGGASMPGPWCSRPSRAGSMPPEARRRRFVRFAPPTGEVGRARVDAWRRLWRFAAPKGAVNRHSLGGSGAMAARSAEIAAPKPPGFKFLELARTRMLATPVGVNIASHGERSARAAGSARVRGSARTRRRSRAFASIKGKMHAEMRSNRVYLPLIGGKRAGSCWPRPSKRRTTVQPGRRTRWCSRAGSERSYAQGEAIRYASHGCACSGMSATWRTFAEYPG
jgi:hypothetical protein